MCPLPPLPKPHGQTLYPKDPTGRSVSSTTCNLFCTVYCGAMTHNSVFHFFTFQCEHTADWIQSVCSDAGKGTDRGAVMALMIWVYCTQAAVQ